jgi:hypothetical protein
MLAQEDKVDSIQLKNISDSVEKSWTYDAEMYAYVQVVKHWWHDLIRDEMTVHTGHEPL